MRAARPRSLSLVAGWIIFCVFCNCIGWGLSALQQLNLLGYSAAFGLSVAAAFGLRKTLFPAGFPRLRLQKLRWRFRRLFPFAFLILACLSILGGVIHAPSNYDALAYRTPRVLHWLAAGSWHWIHTDFHRLNNRGCGMEWVTAPFIVFTRSDRFLFLINVVCFLLLPGRIFGLFARLGVPARAAWHWMWLLPTGYGYLLQAGSIGNDLFGAFFAVAGVEFALRARQSKLPGDLWLAILAAALMTAGKAFNLLLLLPWAVAVWPALPMLVKRPVVSLLVMTLGAGASLIPTALLNRHYCGDWTGLAVEPALLRGGAPGFHVLVNAVLLLLNNFSPPIFPLAGYWNHFILHVIPPSLASRLAQYFEPAGARLAVGEMQMEEDAGLGFGLSILLVAVLLQLRRRRAGGASPKPLLSACRYLLLVPLSAWAAAAYFTAQSGLSCPARYFLPFYPLLLPPLLASGAVRLGTIGRRWWRPMVLSVFLLAGLLLIACPARPLWPARSILQALGADKSSHALLARAWTVYSVYGARADGFAPVRALLPPQITQLGLISYDDPETSLWRPFGSRRILHVKPTDAYQSLKERGLAYVLISSDKYMTLAKIPFQQWLAEHHAQVIREQMLELRASRGPVKWFLVEVR
jgi:hypothetical protein